MGRDRRIRDADLEKQVRATLASSSRAETLVAGQHPMRGDVSNLVPVPQAPHRHALANWHGEIVGNALTAHDVRPTLASHPQSK